MEYFRSKVFLMKTLPEMMHRKPMNLRTLRPGGGEGVRQEKEGVTGLMRDDLLGMDGSRYLGHATVVDQHLIRRPLKHDPCRSTGSARNPQLLRRRQSPRPHRYRHIRRGIAIVPHLHCHQPPRALVPDPVERTR